jgi:hypothetical protein
MHYFILTNILISTLCATTEMATLDQGGRCPEQWSSPTPITVAIYIESAVCMPLERYRVEAAKMKPYTYGA